MIISTTDPISLTDVKNPENHPFVVEGVGENALKIYFENDPVRLGFSFLDIL